MSGEVLRSGARHASLLAAMGIEVWRPRDAGSAHRGSPATVDARVPGHESGRSSVQAGLASATAAMGPTRASAASATSLPWDQVPARGPPVGTSESESGFGGAVVSSAPTRSRSSVPADSAEGGAGVAEPGFVSVQLSLWRTGRALLVAAADDPAPTRFVSDLQRSIDPDPAFGLRSLPAFEWPPRGRPELGNAPSLRSAWGAMLRRVHREHPLALILVFGAVPHERLESRSAEPDVPSVPRPAILLVPPLAELVASPLARRSLWSLLRDLP